MLLGIDFQTGFVVGAERVRGNPEGDGGSSGLVDEGSGEAGGSRL